MMSEFVCIFVQSHLCLWKDVTSLRGNAFLFSSSQQLPCLRLTPLKGFLSLHSAHQGHLESPHALLPELQRNRDMVSSITLGPEVTGHHQKQLTQTLIVFLNQLFTAILDCEKSSEMELC